MKIIFIFLILSSCSPMTHNKCNLPEYSDMSAAEDAGKIFAPQVPEGM